MHVLAAALVIAAIVDDFPPALRKAIDARMRIERAQVDWARSKPLRHPEAEPNYIRSFLAGKDVAQIVVGTPSGVTGYERRDKDGPITPVFGKPLTKLRNSEGFWDYNLYAHDGALWRTGAEPPAGEIIHMESSGLMPLPEISSPPADAVTKLIQKRCGAAVFREEVSPEGVYRVEAKSAERDARLVWHIDPRLAWNCTRVEFWSEGTLSGVAATEYESIGNVLVPVATAYFNSEGDVFVLDKVDRAEVNSPNLPAALMPEHIGIESGIEIFVRGERERDTLVYAGNGQLYPRAEFLDKLKRKEIELGPKAKALWAGQPVPFSIPDATVVGGPVPAETPSRAPSSRPMDEWERYTRDFIREFDLNDEQQQKATLTLRSCQLERDHYLRGRKRELDTLGQHRTQATDDSARTAIDAKMVKLNERVQHIFEQKLKPKLEELPTRAQRDRVAQESGDQKAP
jgi:hypothetical protein